VQLLLICLGGAVGTGARYAVQTLAVRWLGIDFPYGTLIVNVVGSLLIGLVQQVGLTSPVLSDTARLALSAGLLGGFTTYSAFSYETLGLLTGGAWGRAALNVVVTSAACLFAAGLGVALGRVVVGAPSSLRI
jgi:CrcB protein